MSGNSITNSISFTSGDHELKLVVAELGKMGLYKDGVYKVCNIEELMMPSVEGKRLLNAIGGCPDDPSTPMTLVEALSDEDALRVEAFWKAAEGECEAAEAPKSKTEAAQARMADPAYAEQHQPAVDIGFKFLHHGGWCYFVAVGGGYELTCLKYDGSGGTECLVANLANIDGDSDSGWCKFYGSVPGNAAAEKLLLPLTCDDAAVVDEILKWWAEASRGSPEPRSVTVADSDGDDMKLVDWAGGVLYAVAEFGEVYISDVKGVVADGLKLTLTGADGSTEELQLTADSDVELVLAFWKSGGGAIANE
jgi:hypothetical protein